ncbi:MAG TPA: Sapep family Mn(2+)-dependent dipeptidase [Thermoanaerobaculia bacterium]|jgi:predicted dipeptidase|nr:Sapep family Mn(2+)-dependent dipeptidase [Thermoanaerobaculia bacterium]
MQGTVVAASFAILLGTAGQLVALGVSCPEAPLAAGAKALPRPEGNGPAAFAAFRQAAAATARAGGRADIAARLAALVPGRPVVEGDAGLASCVLRAYVRARYGERIVRDLQAMLGFRTFAEEGKENWSAPELLRQRQWLIGRAAALGLAFKDYDGRVDEITLPGPKPVLALLAHGDVQDVAGQTWSSPPFEGRRVGDRIVGRGTEDDKGPAVAALYTLAALKDSGWPLGATVRLVIANGEESSWDEIPYYLARASMPDMTVGLDAAYPVTHAQKGYGVLTFRPGKPAAAPLPGRFRVVRITGGSGVSIIPERGEALLAPEPPAAAGLKLETAVAELSRRAAEWAQRHPPARLVVTREGDQVKIVALGKGGHSSEPRSGHNALGDLTAFLATLDLTFDPQGALAAFMGASLGTETDGQSLGLAHHDDEMGDLTANLSLFKEEKGQPAAVVNLRSPRGVPQATIERRLAERTALFAQHAGVPIAVQVEISSEPHLAPVDGKVVQSLLAVWREVTGTPGRPVAVGGGTEARLFPGGVDFGPATSMEHYRGHGTDEYMTVDELLRVAELTTAAVWKLARPAL